MSSSKGRDIPKWFIDKYPKNKVNQLFQSDEGFGFEFFWQVLNMHGCHISIIGMTRSGKTGKKHSVLWWLSRIETIITFDTGKPGDIEPLFDSENEDTRFITPIQVLIPFGCKFDIEGIPEGREYIITPVISPEDLLDQIKPNWINIISLRNYFLDERNLKKYLIRVFKGFDLRARKGEFDRWCPASMDFDEAHAMMGTQGVDPDAESLILTRYLSRWQREMAACGIRTITQTQRYKDVPPAIRENSPCYIICRGVNVDNSDNPLIHWLSGFAKKALVRQGWIIINGHHFYSDRPMPFPHFKIPENIKIRYSGYVDEITDPEKDELLQDSRTAYSEITDELIRSSLEKEDVPDDLPDLGIYARLLSSKKGGIRNES